MRRTDDVTEFASTVGTYLARDGYLGFHPDASLFGFALWGDHDARTIERLAPILDAQLDHATGPHAALSDLSRLGTFDPGAYVALGNQIAARAERLGRMVTHHVLVRPSGAAGLMVSGFYNVARPPYPFSIVGSAEEAATALHDATIAALLAEVHGVIDEVSEVSATARLRSVLRAHPTLADVDEAARAMGLSPRTLQRRLREAGTSFRAERHFLQIERAKELLLSSDHKVMAIASEVGFASLAHFSTAFQKATGLAPTAWRERHRR